MTYPPFPVTDKNGAALPVPANPWPVPRGWCPDVRDVVLSLDVRPSYGRPQGERASIPPAWMTSGVESVVGTDTALTLSEGPARA